MKRPGVCRRKNTPAHFSRSRSPSSIACQPSCANRGMSCDDVEAVLFALERSILFSVTTTAVRSVAGLRASPPARSPAASSSGSRAPGTPARRSPATSGRHEPQPVPARVLADRRRLRAPREHRLDDLRLGHAVAVADLRGVRNLLRRRRRRPRRSRGTAARRGSRQAASIPRTPAASDGTMRAVADHDRAGQPVVAHDQLLVDAARRLGVADDLVVLLDGILARPSRRGRHPPPSAWSTASSPDRRASGSCRVSRSARTCACSHSGATSPYTRPRCSAHSPIAYTSGDARAREIVADDDAAVDASPARRARSTLGRMPAATTTMSHSSVEPSGRRDRSRARRRARPSSPSRDGT